MGVNHSPGGGLPPTEPPDKVQNEENVDIDENVDIAENEKTGNIESGSPTSPMADNVTSPGVSLPNINEEFTPHKSDQAYEMECAKLAEGTYKPKKSKGTRSPAGVYTPKSQLSTLDRLDQATVYNRLGPPIGPGHPTTPRSSRPSSCPPERRNILVNPWIDGRGPNAPGQRHQYEQAPFRNDANAWPQARYLWWSSNEEESGRNDPNGAENEVELGTAGQTETEDENRP